MYEAFYDLSSDPFRLLPDPGICFPHRSNARAWAYLRYALKRGEGIVVVTGAPGTGKTTLSERLLAECHPAKTVSIRLVAAEHSPTDLLRKLAYEMGLPVERSDHSMLTLMIERHLRGIERAQRRVLVVIDEAQALSHQALEAMRLLTDLQVDGRPVMQLVLFGQDELESAMSAPGMEQFQQRVIAGCRLEPMNLAETKAYIEYRLTAADWRGDPGVNGPAVLAIYRYSRGVPRHVNKICSRLFLLASSEEKHSLTDRDVGVVVGDLQSELLAPNDEQTQQIVDGHVRSGVFDSAYELALVPDPAARVHRAANAQSRDAQRQRAAEVRDALERSFADGDPYPTSLGALRTQRSRRRRSRLGLPMRAVKAGVRALSRRVASTVRRVWREKRLVQSWLQAMFQRMSVQSTRLRQSVTQSLERRWPVLRTRLMLTMQDLRGKPVAGFVPVAVAAALVVAVTLIVIRPGVQPPRMPRSHLDAQLNVESAVNPEVLDGGRYLDARAKAVQVAHDEPVAGVGWIDTGVARTPPVAELGRDTSVVVDRAPSDGGAVAAVDDDVSAGLVSMLGLSGSSMYHWAMGQVRGSVLWPRSGASIDEGEGEVAEMAAPESAVSAPGGIGDASLPTEPLQGTAQSTNAEIAVVALNNSHDYAAFVRILPPTASGVKPVAAAEPEAESVAQESGEPEITTTVPAEPAADVAATDQSTPDPETFVVDAPRTDATSVQLLATSMDLQEQETEPEPRRQTGAEIAGLLRHADDALNADRLLLPESTSAYSYLKRVLDSDPGNPQALAGIARIVDRYAALASEAIGAEDYDRAERFVARGMRVQASNPAIKRVKAEVDAARAEAAAVALAEAEMARLAAEPEIVEPVVEPKRTQSNFQRLMSLANGL